MSLTKQQEDFLSSFANKGIADAATEAKRIADSEAANVKFQARQAFLADITAQKQAEITKALTDFDNGVVSNSISK